MINFCLKNIAQKILKFCLEQVEKNRYFVLHLVHESII
jgi:hypothetical protein